MGEKWEAARRAAEAVSYLALTGGDRLRVVCLQQDGNRMSPQLSGRQAYARLEQFLDTCVPQGGGTLTEKVMRTEGLRKGLCFLISDCYDDEGIGTALDSLRYREQECAVIQTLSAFELDPALDGALKLTDSENGETVNLLADREVLEGYRRTLEKFLADVRECCFRRETPYALLDAGRNFEEEWIPLVSSCGVI